MNIPLSLLTICHVKALESNIDIPEINTLDWKVSIEKAKLLLAKDKYYTCTEAARRGYLDVIVYLYGKNGKLKTADTDDLAIAARRGHLEVVQFLYENGKTMDKINNALFHASASGHLDVVSFLIPYCENINSPNFGGLAWAAREGHLDVIKLLIAAGADIHACGNLAIMLAILHNRHHIIRYLHSLSQFAIRNDLKKNVIRDGHLETFKYLYENGEYDNILMEEIMEIAIENDRKEIIEYLMK